VLIAGELASFTELVAALKSMKPDVVLMDLHMPGEEQADTLKRHAHGTCLIAMSLWDDAESHSLAESFGATRLLEKSTLATTLVGAIHECMSKRERPTPNSQIDSLTRRQSWDAK
jgi:DNA-binding NarL/FixJ family response regulator